MIRPNVTLMLGYDMMDCLCEQVGVKTMERSINLQIHETATAPVCIRRDLTAQQHILSCNVYQ